MKTVSEVSCVNQRGASIIATLILVVLVGTMLMAGLKIVPSYMDNNVVVNIMESMEENTGLEEMSISEIRGKLMKELNINGVRDFDSNDVVLTRIGKKEFIDINYESRVPLFYNVEAVVVFTNRFDK